MTGNHWKTKIRTARAVIAVAIASVSAPAAATASPWDPHVRVWFNANACAGGAQWGWYSTGDGESGWVTWNAGYQGYFDLWRVPSSGSVTKISWGITGRTCGTRYFNINRPTWGTTAALGWIG